MTALPRFELGDRQGQFVTTTPRVALLSVPDCPHVEQARVALRRALADAGITTTIEKLVGAYPSPTILIDGRDVVTGAPPASGARCRLDLPTTAQIATMLNGHQDYANLSSQVVSAYNTP